MSVSVYWTTRYYEKKAAGICVDYGCSQPCDGDTVRCAEHRARKNQMAQRRLEDTTKRRRKNRHDRRWRRRRYALGLCARCPAPHDDDSYFCITCEDYLAQHKRRPHAKATAARPAARGLSASAAG